MKKLLISSIIIVSGLVSATSVHAATYYVATNGSDLNSGTQASPFLTLQQAANTVNPGDTVIVEDGTYSGTPNADTDNSQVLFSRGGSAGNWVTFKAQNKGKAIIDGLNNTLAIAFEWNDNISYIRLQDFNIQFFNSAAVSINGANNTNIDIIGNSVHDIGRLCTSTPFGIGGLFTNRTSSAITFEHNVFHDIGRLQFGEQGCGFNIPNLDHGIYLSSPTNVLISNNVFYSLTSGWGIQLGGNQATNTDIAILNNTFLENNPNRMGDVLIENGDGSGSAEVDVRNNIFYQPNTAGVKISAIAGMTGRITITNNITFQGVINNGTCSTCVISGNDDNTDPLLVSTSTMDYRLQAGSLAIDSGFSTTTVTNDFNNYYRPQGSGIDMGAFEFPQTELFYKGNVSLKGNIAFQ